MKSVHRLLVLALALTIPACGADPTAGWTTYRPADSSYSIKFPDKPSERTMSSPTRFGTIDFVMASYQMHGGRREYFASSVRYHLSPDRYSVEKGLDGARDQAARSTQAELANEKKLEYRGAAGRDFEMVLSRKPGRARERMYLTNSAAGQVLYQALVIDADGQVDDAQADAFLKSLTFDPK